MKRVSIFLVAVVVSCSIALADELATLQANYEREKARVLAPVELKYDQALAELKLRHTKAGRLDEALAVAEVIQSREAAEATDWLNESKTNWKWHSGGRFEILPGGECKHSSWRNPGKWKRLDEDRIEVVNEKEQTFTLHFENRASANVTAEHGWGTKLSLIKED